MERDDTNKEGFIGLNVYMYIRMIFMWQWSSEQSSCDAYVPVFGVSTI